MCTGRLLEKMKCVCAHIIHPFRVMYWFLKEELPQYLKGFWEVLSHDFIIAFRGASLVEYPHRFIMVLQDIPFAHIRGKKRVDVVRQARRKKILANLANGVPSSWIDKYIYQEDADEFVRFAESIGFNWRYQQ